MQNNDVIINDHTINDKITGHVRLEDGTEGQTTRENLGWNTLLC